MKTKASYMLIALMLILQGCSSSPKHIPPPKPPDWVETVRTRGQPDPIPVAWVKTPEGRFAHDIVLPEPLSADSGYKPTMTPKEYWEHLCATEAGFKLYRRERQVEGFLWMRPKLTVLGSDANRAWYEFEAPDLQSLDSTFIRNNPFDRATSFINGKGMRFYFRFYEEPGERGYLNIRSPKHPSNVLRTTIERSSEQRQIVEVLTKPTAKYGITWRGVNRSRSRELLIGGEEWIFIDLETNEVIAVLREYSLTGTRDIYWLNAHRCTDIGSNRNLFTIFVPYIVEQVLYPVGDKK